MNQLLVILVLLFSFSSFSQDTPEIDSLREVLTNNNLSSEQNIKTRIELAKELKKTNPEEGVEILRTVLKEAKGESLVETHAYIAENYAELSQMEKVDFHINEAFRISDEEGLTDGTKRAYKSHHNCYKEVDRQTAYNVTKEAIKFAEKVKDHDFSRVIFNNRGLLEYRYKRDIDEALKWFKKSLAMARKSKNEEKIAGLTMNLGAMYYQNGKYPESLEYYEQSLKALESFENLSLHGKVYLNIAITKYSLREMDSAIYYTKKSLDKYEEAGDSMNMASSYIQLGGIKMESAEYKESIKWLTSAMEIYDDLPNTDYKKYRVYKMLSMNYSRVQSRESQSTMISGMRRLSRRIGDSAMIAEATKYRAQYYNEYGDSLEQAIELLDKANTIYKALGLTRYMESLYLDFGNTYQKMKQPKKAKPYFEKALAVYERYPERQKENIAGTLSNLGVIAYDLGEYNESILYYKRALQMRQELNIPRDVLDSYLTLRNTYEAKKDYTNAFKYAKLYSVLKDSIFKDDLSKDLAEMRTKYETDKKEQENKLLQKDNELTSAELEKSALENEKNKTMLAASAGGGILVLILGLVTYRSYLRKRKDNDLLTQKNEEIQLQNAEIKEKNEEIMDSIRYAQRIQETILPASQMIKSYFSNSFILYKPKELVSGDFYWIKSIEEESGDKLMFSAVDCTGHGVPGAFVSIVGHNGLNRAVNEFQLRSPKLILEKLNELVVESFAPNEEMSVKDGMDLAFCMIDESDNLHYAGANNPLWIVSEEGGDIDSRINSDFKERIQSKNIGGVVLTEIKADKRPIGAYDGENVFNEHSIKLRKGDTIYVFSDGYADQFGGDRNKKMKSGKFKEVLAKSYPELMTEQREILKNAFEDWKGDYEQIDDVCVIGYRYEGE